MGRYPLFASFSCFGRPRGRYCNARPVSFSSFWMNFSGPQGRPLSTLRRSTSSLCVSSPSASQADQSPILSNCFCQDGLRVNATLFPAPTSPARGLGEGDPCRAGFARHAAPATCGAARAFASRVMRGAESLARGCTRRGPPIKNSTGLPLAQRAVHDHGTACPVPASQPARRLPAKRCKRRDGGRVGTSLPAG